MSSLSKAIQLRLVFDSVQLFFSSYFWLKLDHSSCCLRWFVFFFSRSASSLMFTLVDLYNLMLFPTICCLYNKRIVVVDDEEEEDHDDDDNVWRDDNDELMWMAEERQKAESVYVCVWNRWPEDWLGQWRSADYKKKAMAQYCVMKGLRCGWLISMCKKKEKKTMEWKKGKKKLFLIFSFNELSDN